MKILQIISTPMRWSATGRMATMMGREFQKAGHQVIQMAIRGREDDSQVDIPLDVSDLTERGLFPTHAPHAESSLDLVSLSDEELVELQDRWHLRVVMSINKLKPDVIVVHNLLQAAYGAVGRGVPVIAFAHGNELPALDDIRIRHTADRVLKELHCLLSTNASVLSEFNLDNKELIGGAVDTDAFPEKAFIKHERPKIGVVVRYARSSGTERLAAIARQMRDQVDFVVAGDAEAIESWNLIDLGNIFVRGLVSPQEMSDFYADCDGFLCLTSEEYWSSCVLEAMSTGRAAVVPAGGFFDEVASSDCVLAVEGPETGPWVDAVKKIIYARKKMGKAAAARARKKFGHEQQAQKILMMMEQIQEVEMAMA